MLCKVTPTNHKKLKWVEKRPIISFYFSFFICWRQMRWTVIIKVPETERSLKIYLWPWQNWDQTTYSLLIKLLQQRHSHGPSLLFRSSHDGVEKAIQSTRVLAILLSEASGGRILLDEVLQSERKAKSLHRFHVNESRVLLLYVLFQARRTHQNKPRTHQRRKLLLLHETLLLIWRIGKHSRETHTMACIALGAHDYPYSTEV